MARGDKGYTGEEKVYEEKRGYTRQIRGKARGRTAKGQGGKRRSVTQKTVTSKKANNDFRRQFRKRSPADGRGAGDEEGRGGRPSKKDKKINKLLNHTRESGS